MTRISEHFREYQRAMQADIPDSFLAKARTIPIVSNVVGLLQIGAGSWLLVGSLFDCEDEDPITRTTMLKKVKWIAEGIFLQIPIVSNLCEANKLIEAHKSLRQLGS